MSPRDGVVSRAWRTGFVMPLKRFCNVVRIDGNRDPARMDASAGGAHAWVNRLQSCSLETSMDHEHDTVVVDSGGSAVGPFLPTICRAVLRLSGCVVVL